MGRTGSATIYLVFSNIASLFTIAFGIIFIGDSALDGGSTVWTSIGLTASVASSVWYSVQDKANSDVLGEATEEATKKRLKAQRFTQAMTETMDSLFDYNDRNWLRLPR